MRPQYCCRSSLPPARASSQFPQPLGPWLKGSLALFVVWAIPGMVCTLTVVPVCSVSLVASVSLREALSVYYSKQVSEPQRE